MWSPDDRFAAFFRKTFVVPDGAAITSATITTLADDDIAVWVNGTQVYIEPDFGILDGNVVIRQPTEITDQIVPGDNLIAVQALDTVGGCRLAVVSGTIYYTTP
jgi:hypothetical protein